MDVANTLFENKKYDWCLFIGHLVLEKVLKAHYVKKYNKLPPKIHNLVRLAEVSGVELTEEKKLFLDEINDFNIEIRYPDYRFDFYKKCTEEFTKKYFDKIKECYNWLLLMLR